MKKSLKPAPVASPMMVMMIATYGEDGTPNLMNAAWGGQMDTDLFVLSLSKPHKTVKNILARKAFTIGFPSAKDIADCDYVGMVSGNQVPDKLKNTGLTPLPSKTVDAPYIEEFPLTYECEVAEIIDDEEYGFYVVGRVKGILVDEGCHDGKAYDVKKMDLCFFTSLDNTYRRFGESLGNAFSLGKKGK